jgi:hypothetical protein
MEGGGADDAQPLAGPPAAGRHAAGRHAVDRHVAGAQSGHEPGQRVQIALHMDVALAAPVNLLTLARRAAGHIDQGHVAPRDAEPRAEGRSLELVGQKIRLVGGRKPFPEDLERGDRIGRQPGIVHPRPVIGAGGMEPVELAAQLYELQLFQIATGESGDLGQQRRRRERGFDSHAQAGAKTGKVISGVTSRNWTLSGI